MKCKRPVVKLCESQIYFDTFVSLWNSLPFHTKNPSSVVLFQCLIKQYNYKNCTMFSANDVCTWSESCNSFNCRPYRRVFSAINVNFSISRCHNVVYFCMIFVLHCHVCINNNIVICNESLKLVGKCRNMRNCLYIFASLLHCCFC